MQKSHDFDFSDPLDVPNTYRVVQFRSPVPRSLSAFENFVISGGPDNEQAFRHHLVDGAWYFYRFYEKWIQARSDKFFILTYEELTADPLQSLLAFFRFIAMPVDNDDLALGIQRSVGSRARTNSSFRRADVYAHRYASLPVLGNFEDIVIRNCPGYYPSRYFSPIGDSDESLIGFAFNARMAVHRGNKAEALAITEKALKWAPGDHYLVRCRELAVAMQG